jgi:hypothetical protein
MKQFKITEVLLETGTSVVRAKKDKWSNKTQLEGTHHSEET